jgi:hypothetical protein
MWTRRLARLFWAETGSHHRKLHVQTRLIARPAAVTALQHPIRRPRQPAGTLSATARLHICCG